MNFGSFTAIHRAGGGYALLSGQWSQKKNNPAETVIGEKHIQVDQLYFEQPKSFVSLPSGPTAGSTTSATSNGRPAMAARTSTSRGNARPTR